MTHLERYVLPIIQSHLTEQEKAYLTKVFDRFDGFPNLEQMWALMDEPWIELECNPLYMDERITAYYQHPVWMLNGLFIEQHAESLENRRIFTDWIVQQAPSRIADFGGGFGGLARFVGEALPNSQVEVIDPHPHPAAIAMAASTPNVRFVSELRGSYDLLVATDVFEHVPDPLGLVAETAGYLHADGQYLMANCFQPVIRCHLPQLFHFHFAWDAAMRAMGFQINERVRYGRSYRQLNSSLDVDAAHKVGDCAKQLYMFIRHLPRGKKTIGELLMRGFCRKNPV